MFRKLLKLLRAKGAKNTIVYLFGRYIYSRSLYVFFLKNLTASAVFSVPDDGVYRFTRFTLDRVKEFRDLEDSWHDKKRLKEKLEKGRELYCLEYEGKRVSYQWIEAGNMEVPEIDFNSNLPADVAYVSGVYTARPFRAKGLAQNLYARILEILRQRQVRTVFLVIETPNRPSWHVAEKIGFTPYAELTLVNLFKIKYYFLKRGGIKRTLVRYWGGRDRESLTRHLQEYILPHALPGKDCACLASTN